MRKFLYPLLLLLVTFCTLTACSNDDDEAPAPSISQRTIIIYMTGDNNLSSYIYNDFLEMKTASKSIGSSVNLVAYVDLDNQNPYIAQISNGSLTYLKKWDSDIYSTSPDNMHDILQTIITKFPAKEYGIILEGHGSGTLQSKDTISTAMKKLYAYGADRSGESGSSNVDTYTNIPSLATVLSNLKTTDGSKVHFDFLLFDCCCMQTVESGYELRNYTDYIIAPLTEVPADGADYKKLLPILTGNISSSVQQILDTYVDKRFCGSVVKTAEFDNLLYKTKECLAEIYSHGVLDREGRLDLNLNNVIYYYTNASCNVLHDLQDVLYKQYQDGTLSATTYNSWKTALASVVPAKTYTKSWVTQYDIDFNSFDINDDTYGGLSALIPQNFSLYTRGSNLIKAMNAAINEFEWGWKIGWKQYYW